VVKTPQRFHEISIVRLISAAKPPPAAMRRISEVDFFIDFRNKYWYKKAPIAR